MLFSYAVYVRMKNSQRRQDLIERARSIARAQQTTLNAAFRQRLAQFTARSGDTQSFDAVMTRMRHVDAGQHYGRDEMNAR
jgi:hypothetical protein